MKKWLLLFLVLCGCTTTEIQYRPDIGFLVSAVADSPEFPVRIDGYNCEDMSGKPGLCSLRLKQYRILKFQFEPRQYAYRLHIVCSKATGFEQSYDVDVDKPLLVEMPYKHYENLKSFICIGEVFPRDREDKISAKFEVRVKLIGKEYVEREKMRLEKDGDDYYLVLGEHAYFSRVYDKGEWKSYKKKTKIQVFDIPSLMAYSESYSFRVNSFKKGD